MRRALLVLSLVLVALLCGCSTLGEAIDGIVDWVRNPHSATDSARKTFQVTGTAKTERQALLLAYSAVSEEIAYDTGVPMSQEQIRELSTVGTVADMDLRTTDVQSTTSDGMVTVRLTVSASREYLDSITTDEAIARRTLEEDVERIVLEGDELMKQGQDIKAVVMYMQSMELSYGADFIDEEYSFEVIRDEVVSIISRLYLRLVSSDSTTASCRIRATRRRSFFRYALEDCPITARIDVYDQYSSDETMYLSYSTGARGNLDFTLSNTMAKRNGTVRFTFGLENALENLVKVAGDEACSPIRDILDEKSVGFTYVLGETYGTTAVVAVVYDGSDYSDSPSLSGYVADKLTSEGLTAVSIASSASEEDDTLKAEALEACPGCSYIVVVKVGLRDIVKSQTGYTVVYVEGKAEIWKVSDSSLVFSTGIVSSSSMKLSQDEAFEEACSVFVQGAYETLRQQYV